MKRVAARALMLAAVAAAGCGSEEPSVSPPSGKQAGPPAAERPDAPTPTGPPPAWLETERGTFWLGYSTFCWGGMCADYIAPSCDDERHVPRIVVRRGERVTAHLGFEPREVTLISFPRHDQERLDASRTPAWRVDGEGAFSLFTRPKDARGDASYVACLEFAR